MVELTLEEKKSGCLEILNYIHNLCKKADIQYFLAYGTLLGAIRHKGYIPWDDDVDIWVPFEQFEVLMDLLEKDGKYRIYNYFSSEDWGEAFSKVCDKRTCGIKRVTGSNDPGLSVDIFPLVSCSPESVGKLFYYKRMATRMWSYEAKLCKNTLKKTAYGIYHMFGKNNFYYRDKFNSLAKRSKGKTFYFADMTAATPLSDADFGQVEVGFEGCKFSAPSGYDKILHFLYNDYMELPPESEREGHNAIYWKD